MIKIFRYSVAVGIEYSLARQGKPLGLTCINTRTSDIFLVSSFSSYVGKLVYLSDLQFCFTPHFENDCPVLNSPGYHVDREIRKITPLMNWWV
jgi:hypothetical protein